MKQGGDSVSVLPSHTVSPTILWTDYYQVLNLWLGLEL